MKKYLIILNLICIYLFSCKPSDSANGSQVDEATMISIMTEVFYMDSHFAELNSYVKDSIVYTKFKELLRKHSISKEQFEKAQAYYNDNDKAHQRLIEGLKQVVKEASMK